MQITDAERLIMVMLSDVMEHLDICKTFDPVVLKGLLLKRHDWAVGPFCELRVTGEPWRQEDVDETNDILSMWSFLEYSINKLKPENMAEIVCLPFYQFSGFDAFNDPHSEIARIMIEHLGLYQDLEDRQCEDEVNHNLEFYRDLFPRFQCALRADNGEPLDYDTLRQLLSTSETNRALAR